MSEIDNYRKRKEDDRKWCEENNVTISTGPKGHVTLTKGDKSVTSGGGKRLLNKDGKGMLSPEGKGLLSDPLIDAVQDLKKLLA